MHKGFTGCIRAMLAHLKTHAITTLPTMVCEPRPLHVFDQSFLFLIEIKVWTRMTWLVVDSLSLPSSLPFLAFARLLMVLTHFGGWDILFTNWWSIRWAKTRKTSHKWRYCHSLPAQTVFGYGHLANPSFQIAVWFLIQHMNLIPARELRKPPHERLTGLGD